MNGGHYPPAYLKRWLKELAELRYDTILWEVEDCIRWENCPECVSPDAYEKDDFRDVLAYASELGLRAIPLLQTIGHAEYVLKHAAYQHLAELPGEISQYCPLHEELMPFLHRWIAEYFSIFGPVEYFHVGADEAWHLGRCDRCAAKVAETSLSQLYVDHVNKVIEPIIAAGSTPVIWGDMILHHHQALHRLNPRIMIFDWMYDICRTEKKVFVWGEGLKRREELSADTRQRFGAYLFPDGEQAGEMETFYTADFLADQGRAVVTCPASSSYGDTVFAPRLMHHLNNCFDSMRKGSEDHLNGLMLTSWSVHLFPWELQRIFMAVNLFLQEQPHGDIDQYKTWYSRRYHGFADEKFWEAVELLAAPLRWALTVEIGHSKKNLAIPETCILGALAKMTPAEKAEEVKRVKQYKNGYEKALELLRNLDGTDTEEMACWKLAAENLTVRAQGSLVLLDEKDDDSGDEAKAVMEKSMGLMERTQAMYENKLCPSRRKDCLHWLYGAFHHALEANMQPNLRSQ